MKKYLFLATVVFLSSCSSGDDVLAPATNVARSYSNVSYGTDSQQLYDIFLPEGRGSNTPVLILIHGGGWSAGSKADMAAAFSFAQLQFPNYAIVNMDYRLATPASPAYPKQIDDIQAVIDHIESQNYSVSQQYAFLGVSAGAHLSMLYAYKFDPNRKVKAVCSLVGPTDFTDPAYVGSELETTLFPNLVGINPTQALIEEVSPALQVNANDPATIQFLGNSDPLVPISQGTRLETQLNNAGITNEIYYYNAGHGDFSFVDTQDIFDKLGVFFRAQVGE